MTFKDALKMFGKGLKQKPPNLFSQETTKEQDFIGLIFSVIITITFILVWIFDNSKYSSGIPKNIFYPIGILIGIILISIFWSGLNKKNQEDDRY